ncbi:MAG: DUF1145 domain-containing protein [Candidatus Odinarchaeota archaeon]
MLSLSRSPSLVFDLSPFSYALHVCSIVILLPHLLQLVLLINPFTSLLLR